jgi:hypothetical protein
VRAGACINGVGEADSTMAIRRRARATGPWGKHGCDSDGTCSEDLVVGINECCQEWTMGPEWGLDKHASGGYASCFPATRSPA